MRATYKNRWSREELLHLVREHGTHASVASHLGIGRSTLTKILSLYEIKTDQALVRKHGNAAWQELGR